VLDAGHGKVGVLAVFVLDEEDEADEAEDADILRTPAAIAAAISSTAFR
jgi:hypothetical protein